MDGSRIQGHVVHGLRGQYVHDGPIDSGRYQAAQARPT